MINNNLSITLLRYSLAIIFIWFGVLKMFNASQSMEILKNSLPADLGISQPLLFAVAFLEILIGIGLSLKRTYKFTALIMIILLTIMTIMTIFTQGFDPRFPVLSLAGEYALKNLALISAGIVLVTFKTEKNKSEDKHEDPK